MPFLLNGVDVEDLRVNGVQVDRAYLNEVEVYQRITDTLIADFEPIPGSFDQYNDGGAIRSGSVTFVGTDSFMGGTHCARLQSNSALTFHDFPVGDYNSLELYIKSVTLDHAQLGISIGGTPTEGTPTQIFHEWTKITFSLSSFHGRQMLKLGTTSAGPGGLLLDYIWAKV